MPDDHERPPRGEDGLVSAIDPEELPTDRASDSGDGLEPTPGAMRDSHPTISFVRDKGQPTKKVDPTAEGKPEPIPAVVALPKSFGRYGVLRFLGQGGFGRVYVGHDEELDRDVAIKVPIRVLSEAEIRLFFLEARRLAKLKHPGIVTVYDVGVQDGQCFIVSDFVNGTSLREWLDAHKPTPEQTVEIVAAVADALDHVHAVGTIHRDIKPANIILDEANRPVLLDFGLAINEAEFDGPSAAIVGTPAYMSPEQARGEGHRIDGRTDIYSLGVILYVMLSGRRPFRSTDVRELLRQVREDEPQPPRQIVRAIPKDLEQVCLKAMAKRIGDRYTTAGDLAEALRDAVRPKTAPAPSWPTGPSQPDKPSMKSESSKPCIVCGREIPPGATSCESCDGSSKSNSAPAAEMPSLERKLHETERRQVTVLNCGCELEDVETALSALDPEIQHELLVEFRQRCREAITRLGGTVAVATAEGLQACFGYPVAHEDDARRAVETALTILDRIEGLNLKLRSTKGVGIAPWATIHTGTAQVGELETGEGLSIVGEASNVATRLDKVVEPGWIAVSEATRKLTMGFYAFEGLGSHLIRGLATPIAVHRVTGRGEAASRIDVAVFAGLSPLVGRDQEVGLLKDRWEHVKEEASQLVLLSGEAGIGKSRLVLVLKEFVADDEPGRAASILEWRCSPHYQDSGLYPATECLARILGLDPAENPSSKLDKLETHLKVLKLNGPEPMALFAALLSIPTDGRLSILTLSPQRQREKTLEAMLDWLAAQAARRPLLFIVEDLHWVDPSTLEFLGLISDERPTDRIMTLLTSRPEFVPPWATRANRTTLSINRLTKRQVADLIRKKAGNIDMSDEVVDRLASRTDGVPLFIEEFAKMFAEGGQGADVAIPATLHDLLMSRLDRMPGVKDVAQLGATLGREFSDELILATSTNDEPTLRAKLARLVEAEILFAKGRPPRGSYQFKHALIQDAAYGSMLKAKRQQFHERIALVLESKFPETAKAQPELLAHHYSSAGMAAASVGFWREAGVRSQGRSAHAEAIGHFTRGIEQVMTLPETADRDVKELDLQIKLGVSLNLARGYAVPELEGIQARALTLCGRIGESAPVFYVLWSAWALRLIRDELDTAIELSDQLLALAEARGDRGLIAEALFTAVITKFFRGDFLGCRAACDRIAGLDVDAETYRSHARHTGQDARMATACYRGLSSWYLGEPDLARQAMPEAAAIAREAQDPFSLAYALHHAGWLDYLLRDGTEGIAHGEACVAVSEEQGFAFWKALGTISIGTGRMASGQLDEARVMVEQGIEVFLKTGSRKSMSEYHGFLAEIDLKAGRLDQALIEVNLAIASAERSNNRCQEADLHRIRGEILLAQSPENQPEVEACFGRSIELARSQSARSWELRTAMSLGKLRWDQNRRDEARALLLGVFATFTEGFDTPDLVDARALLERWSPAD